MQSTCALILGMHRSGTSVLTGSLQIAGIYLGEPEHLLVGNETNQKGHFEHERLMQINEAILNAHNCSSGWIDPLPEGWINHPETVRLATHIRNVILNDFHGKELFAIKDPRICLLTPLYHNIFASLNIEVKHIVIERKEIEVAASLNKRNAMPLETSLEWYKQFQENIYRHTHGNPYHKVYFDDFIANPVDEVNRVLQFLKKAPIHDQQTKSKIFHFVDPLLKHHNVSRCNFLLDQIQQIKSLDAEKEDLLKLQKELQGHLQKLQTVSDQAHATLSEQREELQRLQEQLQERVSKEQHMQLLLEEKGKEVEQTKKQLDQNSQEVERMTRTLEEEKQRRQQEKDDAAEALHTKEAEQKKLIETYTGALQTKDALLQKQEEIIRDLQLNESELNSQINRDITKIVSLQEELETRTNERNKKVTEMEMNMQNVTDRYTKEIDTIKATRSWRWNKPLRTAVNIARKHLKSEVVYTTFEALNIIWGYLGRPFPKLVYGIRYGLLGIIWPKRRKSPADNHKKNC